MERVVESFSHNIIDIITAIYKSLFWVEHRIYESVDDRSLSQVIYRRKNLGPYRVNLLFHEIDRICCWFPDHGPSPKGCEKILFINTC